MGEVCEKKSKPWLSVVWRTSNGLMAVFFALASYVQVRACHICVYADSALFYGDDSSPHLLLQINDPDAGLWMVSIGSSAASPFSRGCAGWWLTCSSFQVGYGVPAVLSASISFRPHVTGIGSAGVASSFLFCTLEDKSYWTLHRY